MKNNVFLRRSVFGMAAAGLVAASFISTGGNATYADMASEARDLEEFTKITILGAAELDVTAGKSQEVTVRTEDDFLKEVLTYVKNGTLYIDMREKDRRRRFWDNVDVEVNINVENLEGIEVLGAIDGEFNDIDAENFDIEIKGAADLDIEGKCGTLNLDVKGAGDINAKNFECSSVEVQVKGAGSASVYAKEDIDADVSGVGSISIYGEPAKVRKHVGGIGSISIK